METKRNDNHDNRSRRNRGWIWAAAILGGLLILTLTCVVSTVWGGVIGFAIGRRSAYRMMMPGMPFGSPQRPEPFGPMPELPDMPDMPDFPDMPQLAERPWLGVTFVMMGEGALVTDVTPGSPAEREGLAPDDIITAVESRAVTEATPLDELILRYDPGDRVELKVLRDGRERTVRVRLASWQDIPWQEMPRQDGLPMQPLWEG